MTSTSLPLSSVRLVQLAAQGLLRPPDSPATKADVLNAIRRMGALQIDTIHVVARSPYLALFSRLGSYAPVWLDELLAEGALFEYWSHAACFLPIEDYALYAGRMADSARRFFEEDYEARHTEAVARVMQALREDGAVRSADFERTDGQKGGWWNWKEEKHVLEYLHTSGQVMIARREKFQRVYDLRERVLPGWKDAQALSREEAYRALALKAVRCLGIALPRWVPDYFRLSKRDVAARLQAFAQAGLLLPVQVEGWDGPAYLHPDNLPLLEAAQAGELEATLTTLLSPFDPLTWHRERASTLFGFDFTLECYLPAEKRQYGYFSLPILHRGRLIGRIDPKAHRKEGIFEVRSIHWEPGIEPDSEMAAEVRAAIQRCADWHGTPEVKFSTPLPALD